MFSRRFLLQIVLILLLTVGCDLEQQTVIPKKLTIGVVSYEQGTVSLDKYNRFKEYIAQQTHSLVELEPTYNELQAIQQIQRKQWDIVFAPPGLVAIAISKELYTPLFSMGGVSSGQRSLLVVLDNKPIKKVGDLAYKTVALGQIGSAAGYYVPLYDLYGLTLAQIRFAPTPKTTLQWLSEGSIDASALSEMDFELYRREFPTIKFRILHTSRWLPSSLVLLGSTVERNLQYQIKKAMSEAPAHITADAGYVPTAKIPSYQQFIKLVEKVRPLEEKVKQTPAVLGYEEQSEKSKVSQ